MANGVEVADFEPLELRISRDKVLVALGIEIYCCERASTSGGIYIARAALADILPRWAHGGQASSLTTLQRTSAVSTVNTSKIGYRMRKRLDSSSSHSLIFNPMTGESFG
ncbi:hypothetical protein GCM10009655_09610 [Rhodoglobus aureus]|uniref:Uncharacterized protein n=1 Tax=Rhodoglobus aureus TaxID=191497 RepID=A0ABN1VI64_9MICO